MLVIRSRLRQQQHKYMLTGEVTNFTSGFLRGLCGKADYGTDHMQTWGFIVSQCVI